MLCDSTVAEHWITVCLLRALFSEDIKNVLIDLQHCIVFSHVGNCLSSFVFS